MIDCDFGEKMSSWKILDSFEIPQKAVAFPSMHHQSVIFKKYLQVARSTWAFQSQLLMHLCIPLR